MAMGGKFVAKSMPFRFLGNSGLKVSGLSFGTWITVHGQNGLDITKSCMKEAWENGCNYFDTAEVYQSGECEKIVGQALKELEWPRSDYVISTKIFWGGKGPNDTGLSRKHIREAMSKCLSRLQLDYVDIIMAHRPDPWTPMEEIVRAYTDLIREGKALYWGTSEWSAFDVEHANHMATKHSLISPIADQPEYNAFRRDRVESELSPLYKLYNYGLTTWSPLASGLLTGKYSNGIPPNSRFSLSSDIQSANGISADQITPEKLSQIGELAKLVPSLGENVTMAQMMLAWTLKNPNVSTVITGASRPEQIRENFKAVELLPKMDEEFMKKIDDILGNKPKGLESYGRWT